MEQKPHEADAEREGKGRAIELVGILERFTFRNPQSGFAVVRLREEGSGKAHSVVGQMAELAEGQRLRVKGRLVLHPRFGPQVEAETVAAAAPESAEGIIAYLSSGLVKGIGPATARRIVEAFGTEALAVIENEPERLAEIKGLGKRRIADLVAALHAHRDVQEVMVFLRGHGLGHNLAARIVQRYGADASALIQANPYRLADEVIGIGFQTADRLARELGLAPDAPERLEAGILHTLSLAAREGHCFLPRDRLIEATATQLQCAFELLPPALEGLARQNRIVVEPAGGEAPPRVYPRKLHAAECGVAEAVAALSAAPRRRFPLDPERAIDWYAARSGMRLPAAQRQALLRALREPFSIVTGGPGVGKTTIVRALAEILAAKDLRLRLAAPTGRAAKRLEESTGHPAGTVHRLLEYQPGTHRFARHHDHPLEGDLLVVDESSMLDVELAYDLLRAVPPGMRVVLVGDADQLPSVGPGNVLGDLIASARIPVTPLTEIFRQQRGSSIPERAHQILRGQVPEPGEAGEDFFFVEAETPARARALLEQIVTERIPAAFGLDPLRDVQVLCPMYRGEVGADALNERLQARLNPGPGGDGAARRRRLRVGDKVMQVRNDYDLEVFNGDIGWVTAVDGDGAVHVRFGERHVAYAAGDLDQLVPAYAITVHRSQGSEYPAVVMPVLTEHYVMLRRNLLYTAVTRGKRLVVLVGQRRALELAVRRHDDARRFSALAERLRG